VNTNLSLVESEYNPNKLLDALAERLHVNSDVALARTLHVTKTIVKKIRQRTLPVGGALLMRMNEVSSIDIDELRRLMGDRRGKLRIGVAQWDFAEQKRDTAISMLPSCPSDDNETDGMERCQISVS
jgi:hypothetical protein